MTHKEKYSPIQFFRYIVFFLFILELILWNPYSDDANSIILKLLKMTSLLTTSSTSIEIIKWVYPVILVSLFSFSFPEIFRLIKSNVEDTLSRNLITKYIKVKKKYSWLWPWLGGFFVILIFLAINESIDTSKDIIEYLIKIRQNKGLHILLYILVPTILIFIWINNRFVTAFNTNPNELVIIVGKKDNDKSYVISGPMAYLEMKRRLGINENDYDVLIVHKFPEPLTIDFNLDENVKANLSLSIRLGVVVNSEISRENARWLYNAFFDLVNKSQVVDVKNSILVTSIIDEIEQTINQASIKIANEIQHRSNHTSDIQVFKIIEDVYPMYIQDLQIVINERIASILGDGRKILEIEFLSKKMTVDNVGKRVQEDFEDAKKLFLNGNRSEEKRPKLFNQSKVEVHELLISAAEVFKQRKNQYRKLLLNGNPDSKDLDKS